MSEIENLKIDGGSTYTVGNQDIVANEWEASKTYVKDKSYVIREHRLYVCNTTHTSVEPFDPTNWTEITVGDAIAANTTAIGSLSTLTTTDKSSIVGAVNEVDGKIPTWITQASGTNSGTIAGASVFGYYYADQWQAYIYLPFVAKNTSYTVNINSVSADNIGDVTSKCSVVAKQNGYFTVRTTKTMANLPDYYSVCPMRISYSIDFA